MQSPDAFAQAKNFCEESTLYVFSSGRALQSFYKDHGDGFLPQAMTFEGFLKTIKIYKNRALLPESVRPVMLMLAAKNVEIEKLGFEKNFLAFLEHSPFFLSFFDELAAANLELSALFGADIYGEYDDHLEVLKKLNDAYNAELLARGFVDFTSKDFELYEKFLQKFSRILFKIDGFLSAHEVLILDKVSEMVELVATFEVDRYNAEYYAKLGILESAKSGYAYEISWRERKILSQKELRNLAKVEAFYFDDRLSQAALALERVHTWVESGVAPEKLAIVLPSEDFSDYLRLFDRARNLNYAMGESPKNSKIYQNIKRRSDEIKNSRAVSLLELPPKGVDSLHALRDEFEKLGLSEESNAIDEAISLLLPLKNELENQESYEMVELVLRLFSHTKIDDVGGGRIRVLGVLETRGIELTHVVLVDFNEGLIPKPSDKDIFLNSKIRQKCALPTRLERENLQKHYYFSLLSHTKEVAIACVKNDEIKPSRLLFELGIEPKNGAQIYKNTLLSPPREKSHFTEEIFGEIDLVREVFSHTRLQTFLSCARKYYYRYVKKYSEREEESLPKERGILVHSALKESFASNVAVGSRRAVFNKIVRENSKHDPIFSFEMEALIARMGGFFKNEEKRASDGAEPMFLEESIEFCAHDVKFKSIIDRVDRVGDTYFIIDYKVKSVVRADSEKSAEKSSDFQFALYTLALREKVGEGAKIRAFYYDVLNGKMVEEEVLERKIELLKERLRLLKARPINFLPCLDKKVCRNCSYTAICGIEV